MDKGRLESFSDGVIAIIITIMAIVIEPPDDYDLPTLINMLPQILMYAVSFFMIGVNWINHHLLMNTISRVNGKILWANLLYLFFLSFCPVATGLTNGKFTFSHLLFPGSTGTGAVPVMPIFLLSSSLFLSNPFPMPGTGS